MKEIRFRCWIDIDGEKFFGPGPATLLKLIEHKGSISKAAKEMGMSYKKAWDLVNTLNTRGSEPYVISQKGGQKGGGAKLSPTGKKVLAKYEDLVQKLKRVIDHEDELTTLL